MHALQKYPAVAVVAVMVCLLGMETCRDVAGRLLPEALARGLGAGVLLAAEGGQAGAGVVINELHTNPGYQDRAGGVYRAVQRRDDRRGPVRLVVHGGRVLYLPGRDGAACRRVPRRGAEPRGAQCEIRLGADRAGRRPGCSGRTPAGWTATASGWSCATPTGRVVDEVDYQLGFPWPTVGDPVPAGAPGNGPSLQLVNPAVRQRPGRQLAVGVPDAAGAELGCSPRCCRRTSGR